MLRNLIPMTYFPFSLIDYYFRQFGLTPFLMVDGTISMFLESLSTCECVDPIMMLSNLSILLFI